MQKLCALFAALAVAGCAAVWGGSYNVVTKTPSSIVIEYDHALVMVSTLQKAAQEHCEGHGKNAVLSSSVRSAPGIIMQTYLCTPQ